MSTETTNTSTTTASTMRAAVTSSPFTDQKGPRFNRGQATVPRTRTPQPGPVHLRLSQRKPANEPTSPRQHRPQLGHRIGRLRPRHQIIHLPHPPPIQVRLRHPHHRHPNPIEPPPRERRPNLTLQPRTPRPPCNQRPSIPKGPAILDHMELRVIEY